ncbi:phage tail tape measure protein, TP901 family [Xanthobacter versatilis]|uniref:Phage tail tape measure protein, TP901 family n=1 Tax=Xanthobacter autotrophicus (strain ATCC BAA-1158 / Py2) TaxID=78245 RepID=A7INW2_XANP2|nr:phage tail tape measure protein, TP901 family [Xanthobacter autotrophicus Py2]
MSGKTLDVSILVRLVDRVTGPLSVLQRKFAGLAQLSQRIGILGAAVAGISFAVPLASAAAYDQQLRDMAVTAGEFGQGAERMIRKVGRDMEQLALKTGIASKALADARGVLVSGGFDNGLVTDLMPTIGRVSKAASADPIDTAKTAGALAGPLKIAAADMEQSLAMLVVAGKLGAFEFKNMAKELPGLAAQMNNLGVTGKEAVASLGAGLQIAMKATDSPATAANNMKNFLAKLNAPETVKNFEEAGVNLPAVKADAVAKGINPVEAVIQKLMDLTKVPQKEIDAIYKRSKDAGKTDVEAAEDVKSRIEQALAGSKVGKLFGDMQALDFITPMRIYTQLYKQYTEAIKAADVGVIGRDSETQLAGLDSALKETAEISEQAGRRIGDGFAPVLLQVNKGLKAALGWMREVDEAYPSLIDYTLLGVGAFLALVVALAALGPAFAIISAGFGVLLLLWSPIGAAIMGIAALAVLVWANWSTVGPMFARMWEGIKTVFSGFVEWVAGIFTLDSKRAADGVRTMFEGLATIAGGLWDLVKVSWTGFVAWIDGWTAGAFTGAINGIKAAWQGLIDWFKSHVPSFDIQMPDWVKRLYGGQMATLPAVDAPVNPMGDGTGWSAPGFAAPTAAAGTTKVGGEIIVRAEPGTEARVQSDNPAVPMVQDRGLVLGRP